MTSTDTRIAAKIADKERTIAECTDANCRGCAALAVEIEQLRSKLTPPTPALRETRAAEILAAEARGAERERALSIAYCKRWYDMPAERVAEGLECGNHERNEHGAGK